MPAKIHERKLLAQIGIVSFAFDLHCFDSAASMKPEGGQAQKLRKKLHTIRDSPKVWVPIAGK